MGSAANARPVAPRLGLFAWFGVPIPFVERMSLVREAGFEATSLWWEEDDEKRRRLRDLAPDIVRNACLHLDNLHAPYVGCNALWSGDAVERLAMVDRHLGWVEDCALHDVPMLVMHVTQGSTVAPPNAHGLDSMRRIVGAAEERELRIAIENTRGEQHVDWILDDIDSPALGLCYDSSHDWLYAAEPVALLSRWGHRVMTTHLSDTDGRRDRHWLPGEGAVDFERIAAQPAWQQYVGTCLLEVVPKDRAEDVRGFLARAYESGRALRDRLCGIAAAGGTSGPSH
ncbi:MAG: TIM barrel protein [Candidatus Hydrogenedentes bacterium]|nr:TIM barrel protein [Candidatus Hydrogenedentota bacterium]